MSASTEEIARDIVVASITGRPTIWTASELAELYSEVVKAVGEATRAETAAHKRHYS